MFQIQPLDAKNQKWRLLIDFHIVIIYKGLLSLAHYLLVPSGLSSELSWLITA